MAAASWREPAPTTTRPMVEVRCRECRTLICRVETERAKVEAICPNRRCRRGQTHRLGAEMLRER